MSTALAPQAGPEEFRVVVFDHGTGATLAEASRPSLPAARQRALSFWRQHPREIARVLLRGFEVARVIDGEWRPVEKAVRT